ncbi:MAG: Ig-like domain-containing protein, partial [Candidatus Caldarchaeum sp.]
MFSDPLCFGNTATVSVEVYNNVPVAYDATYTVLHDTTLTGQAYGYDQDGDAITAHLVSGPTNATVAFNADGTFVYTPNTHFVGTDSFIFAFSDALGPGNAATVFIDVYNNA